MADPPGGHRRPSRPSAAGWAVLGLLSHAPELSGYELRQWADQSLRYFFQAPATSQIYSELRRLERLGWVESSLAAQSDQRHKRVYRLTTAGGDRSARACDGSAVPRDGSQGRGGPAGVAGPSDARSGPDAAPDPVLRRTDRGHHRDRRGTGQHPWDTRTRLRGSGLALHRPRATGPCGGGNRTQAGTGPPRHPRARPGTPGVSARATPPGTALDEGGTPWAGHRSRHRQPITTRE
ncbi:MAG: hypothetical protein HOV68_07555 [Streptomycetaceae bacterium]|nr:hypothetical protein [Streptomycetaceae bacterium]